jgi:hypothetical protein
MRPPDGHTAVHHTAEQEAEHIHRIEEAGYTSAVPIGDGFMESAVAMAPPHERLSMERRASSVEAMEETARIEDDIGPPPDGGRQAWLTVLAGFLQQFCIFGMSEECPADERGKLRKLTCSSQLQRQPAGILPRESTGGVPKAYGRVSSLDHEVVGRAGLPSFRASTTVTSVPSPTRPGKEGAWSDTACKWLKCRDGAGLDVNA